MYAHGCVDGLSRCVTWLEVAYSNNDDVMAWLPIYYTNCLSEVVVCAQVLSTDCGTENGAMAAAPMFLCRNTAI